MEQAQLFRLSLVAVASAAIGVLVCAVVWFSQPAAESESAPPQAAATPRAAHSDALAVIREWDRDRAAAWARGDATALRQLYVDGSPAGRTDVRMLRRYGRRGLVVRGLQTQILSSAVLAHSTDTLVVRLTDRVSGGTIEGAGLTVQLPQDQPNTRRLWLQRVQGRWLVSRVRADRAS